MSETSSFEQFKETFDAYLQNGGKLLAFYSYSPIYWLLVSTQSQFATNT